MKKKKHNYPKTRRTPPPRPVPEPKTGGRLLHIGEKVMRVPETFRDLDAKGREQGRAMPGVVCYLHPLGRFHGVRFDTPGGGVVEYFQGVRE